MQAMPVDTLDYVEDEDVVDNDNEEPSENTGTFDRYRGNNDDDFDVDNGADQEDDNDDDDEERNDDDNTSATIEEQIGGNEDRPGEREKSTEDEKTTGKQVAKKKEEKKPFKFEAEMQIVCKHLELTHGHRVEEQMQMDRSIKAFGKKKKWLDWRAKMEKDHRKAMMQKFDEDLKLRFQEDVESRN